MNRAIWLAAFTLAVNAHGVAGEPQSESPPPQVLKVDTKGVTASILYEAVIAGGHIPEVRGKFSFGSPRSLLRRVATWGSTTTLALGFAK